MKKLLLSIAVFLSTFFSPLLFAANPLITCDEQKEDTHAIQPREQRQMIGNNNTDGNHALNDDVEPIIEYVSKEEMITALQEKDKEMAAFVANMDSVKDKQIDVLKQQLKKFEEQNKEVNNCLLKDIKAKLNRLKNQFEMDFGKIDIKSEKSVKSFVEKASEKIEEGAMQLKKENQVLLELYKKYKGEDEKIFHVKDENNVFFGTRYLYVKQQMEKVCNLGTKNELLLSILKSIKIVLPKDKACLWDVDKALTQNSFENDNYCSQEAQMRQKLKLSVWPNFTGMDWKWQESESEEKTE